MLWLHVELAVLLCAGTAAFDLLGSPRSRPLRVRLQSTAALAVGGALAVASELAFFAAQGLHPGEVSRQVFVGQSETFPDNHFGWDLCEPRDPLLLIYPTAVLLPFVPAVWRRMSGATRLAVLLTLCLATIPIRRVGVPHAAAVSTLLVFGWVLILVDVHRARPRPVWPLARPALAAAGLVGGGLGATVVLALGFGTASFAPVVTMVLACLLVAAAGQRHDLLWPSAGAATVLLALPVVAVTMRNDNEVDRSRPLAQAESMAAALRPALAGCGVQGTAWVVPGPVELYDLLALTNPTAYYLFHYNFTRATDRVVPGMRDGSIPAVPAARRPAPGLGPSPAARARAESPAVHPRAGRPATGTTDPGLDAPRQLVAARPSCCAACPFTGATPCAPQRAQWPPCR